MNDVSELALELLRIGITDTESFVQHVAGYRIAEFLPSRLEQRERSRVSERAIEAVFRRFSSARADQQMNSLDPELLATAQELGEHDLPDEAGASGEKDVRAFHSAAHDATWTLNASRACSCVSSGICAANTP